MWASVTISIVMFGSRRHCCIGCGKENVPYEECGCLDSQVVEGKVVDDAVDSQANLLSVTMLPLCAGWRIEHHGRGQEGIQWRYAQEYDHSTGESQPRHVDRGHLVVSTRSSAVKMGHSRFTSTEAIVDMRHQSKRTKTTQIMADIRCGQQLCQKGNKPNASEKVPFLAP